CPYDTEVAGRALSAPGLLNDWLFQPNLMATVKRLLRRNIDVIKSSPLNYDIDAIMKASRMSEIDDLVTARTYGHKDCWAYYRAASSVEYVEKIRKPFLAINAEDDPVTPISGVPKDKFANNPCTALALVKHGGHIGFFTGVMSPKIWYLDPVAEFVSAVLDKPALITMQFGLLGGMVDLTETRLATPQTAADFSFPIATPYAIQVEFMQRLFETLERGEFGIFESPTGTGKSLSIICGSLTWLTHHHARAPATIDKDDDRPVWVRDYERKQRESSVNPDAVAREKYENWAKSVRRKESAEQRERKQNARRVGAVRAKASKRGSEQSPHNSDDEVVAEYHSGEETKGDGEYSESVRKLLHARSQNRVYEDSDIDSDEDTDQNAEPEEPSISKIFYASRTHSQLQQFISEIKRTKFGHATPCVTLGSRVQLCTNDEVRTGCASAVLNERCLEMQQNGGSKRCGHLPVQRTPMLDLKDHMQTRAMDIEDLVVQARKLSVCAYYGARASVQQAHVVALPYNMLLSRSAREALG
ncbi:ATP-dependent DNA helicase chl1, partial [Coemansia sp. RSA 2523]